MEQERVHLWGEGEELQTVKTVNIQLKIFFQIKTAPSNDNSHHAFMTINCSFSKNYYPDINLSVD